MLDWSQTFVVVNLFPASPDLTSMGVLAPASQICDWLFDVLNISIIETWLQIALWQGLSVCTIERTDRDLYPLSLSRPFMSGLVSYVCCGTIGSYQLRRSKRHNFSCASILKRESFAWNIAADLGSTPHWSNSFRGPFSQDLTLVDCTSVSFTGYSGPLETIARYWPRSYG